MLDNQKLEFFDLMKATLEVYGQPPPSQDAMRIWWAALTNYDIADVRAGLDEHIRRGKFAPRPADILEILDRIKPDGRPGADEAWAMIPRDEATSAVLTSEMMQALGVAQPLLDEGDQVAARMAFKTAYDRLVSQNKRSGIPVHWIISLGFDQSGREPVIEEALRLKRISADQAKTVLPAQIVNQIVLELPAPERQQNALGVAKQLADKMRVGYG